MREPNIRRADAATCYHEIIIFGHAPGRLYYLIFVVGDHFYSLQLHAQGEAEFGEIGRVCINRLYLKGSRQSHFPSTGDRDSLLLALCFLGRAGVALTFPPRTSSPIIRHPAVCINPFCGGDIVSWLDDDVILEEDDEDEEKAAAE